jgi:endonuclease/exonuclease/phosphatase family metal-dependent hydrolase
VIRLLLPLLLLAASLPAAARELKIATWNLDWLTLRHQGDKALPDDVVPKSAEDRALLRRYALALDADIVAVEEVDGPEVLATLFPPDGYALFFTHDHVIQRVGFAVRRGIPVEQNPDLTALDVQPNAPFPLRSGADITIDLPGAKLRLLAVHLKSGCPQAKLHDSGRICDTLRRQIAPLQGWVAQQRADKIPFVLLGDFNRRMDHPETLQSGLDQAAPLLSVTAGHASPCWGGASFIDHILLGPISRAWMVPDSLRVMVYRGNPDTKDRLSDHCPVSVKLHIPG